MLQLMLTWQAKAPSSSRLATLIAFNSIARVA